MKYFYVTNIFPQINLDNRFLNHNGSTCLLSVDGTYFSIREPIPFDPKWYSHKFNGPGLRYEIGVCIQTGWIVWLNGPFPCGEWSDLAIARSSLAHLLESWERYIADGGYLDSYGSAVTPTGHHLFIDRQRATVRARHETVN